MDFRRLEYFIAAVEEPSFAKAAQRCYISQTAISQQIVALEGELKVALFDRNGYRAKLTPAGKIFYDSSKKIISDYKLAIEQVKILKVEYTNTLKIGLSGPTELTLLPPIIRKFSEQNPMVNVEFKKRTLAQSTKELKNQKLDIIFGLECEVKDIHNMEIIPLFQSKICVITSLTHPWSERKELYGHELKNEKIVVFSEAFCENYYQSFLDSCRKDGFEPNVVKKVDTLEEMLLLVSVGKAIAITSEEVIYGLSQICCIPLKETHHSSLYCLAKNRDRNEKEVENFIQCVLNELR